MKWPLQKSKQIRVYDQFEGKVSLVDVSKLEFAIGFSLPKKYKRFLLKYNGGRIEPNVFNLSTDGAASGIQFLYGFTKSSNYDLKINYDKWLSWGYPNGYLPIGNDGFGNLILLNLKDKYGYIFFWPHDAPEYKLIMISKDFDSFLNSLYEVKLAKSDFNKAIDNEDISYFESRIRNGEQVDEIKNEFGQTGMIRACLAGKVELIKYFRNEGAKLENALFKAAGNGHLEAVKYLISIGCNPDERDTEQNNDTVLIHAAYGGYLDIAKVLIEAGADINAVDKHGQSALRKAIWSENDELISYLESLGAIDSYKNPD